MPAALPEGEARRRRLERRREWGIKNREVRKAYEAARSPVYYQANKEKVDARNKAWTEKNRERTNQNFYERVKVIHKKAPAQRLLQACRKRAKDKGRECDLTREWADKRWTGRCEMTGIEFVIGERTPTAFSPSLDRIDNSRGYTQDNCRFIIWALNRFKMADDDKTMIFIANALVARHRASFDGRD